MTSPPDAPGPVRPGEELDLAALDAYLVRVRPDLDGALEVAQFPSGYSNLTYLVRKGAQEMVLRRPPRGAAIKSAHDMAREHRILTALICMWPKVPRPIALCEDPAVLGAPFYLMERVRGIIPRGKAADALSSDDLRALSESLVVTLAELHGIDCPSAGLMDLGRPEGYVARQVKGWSGRYVDARTEDVPPLERVAGWLEEHRPDDAPPALVHNDYKHDNVVLDPGSGARIIAVLDWEMATIGHPLLDIGTTLAYWTDPDDPPAWRGLAVISLTSRPGSLSRVEVFERHARALGRPPGDAVFAYAFGLFKVAVIAQQIFARYRRDLTADARFAGLGAVVRACGEVAERAIARRRIDRLGD